MRSTEEIKEEIRKVEAAKKAAERKAERCDARLLELAENTAEESKDAET